MIKKYELVLFILGIIGVSINIILIPSTNSQVLLMIIAYWMLLGIIYKTTEKFFFILALICLILSTIPFLLGNMLLAERFSVWEFLFIILGLWQWFFLQLKRKNK